MTSRRRVGLLRGIRLFAGLVGLIVVVLSLAGCAAEPGDRDLADWTLVGPDGARAQVTLPVHLDGRVPAAPSHYALVTTVAVTPEWRGHDLTLVFPRFFGITTLRVNGLEVPPLLEDALGYRSKGPHAWRIPASTTRGDTFSLELDVARTWTMSAWLDTVPRLTTAPGGGGRFKFQRTFDELTSAGALCFALFAGYVYLIVYLTDRGRSAYGWFAVTGLCGISYPLFQTGLIAAFAGPYELLVAGVGAMTATFAQVHFTASYFGLPRPPRAWRLAWAAAFVSIVVSQLYFANARWTGIATIVFIIPGVVSQVVLFARLAARRPRPPHLPLVFGGWAFMSVFAVPDFATWIGFGQPFLGLAMASLCILVICFLQTTALSLEHTASLRQTELLATDRAAKILELEARNRDVLVLNDELRRQIGERSRQLSADLRAHPSEAPAPLLSPGLAVADRYEIVRLIGKGGMGAVYEVKRDADGRRCALKTLQGSANRTARARFAREAEIAAKLVHRNLVSLIDFDVTRSGWMFLVFELVDGAAIAEHAARFGDAPWALEVLAQLADGLHALHAGGIVHRDLKPANVLLGRDGVVKITDFGISTLRADDVSPVLDQADTLEANAAASPALTRTGAIMGTPLYMAPELGSGGSKSASTASDVFSFGVLAYEMLAGAYPFPSPALLEVIQGRTPGAAPSLGSRVPTVAPAVAAAVDACLRIDPAARPTVEALRAVFFAAQATDLRRRAPA